MAAVHTGWGLNLSTVLNLGKKSIFRGSFVYGEGIQNLYAGCTGETWVLLKRKSPTKPVEAALPCTGILAFLDHTWTEKLSVRSVIE